MSTSTNASEIPVVVLDGVLPRAKAVLYRGTVYVERAATPGATTRRIRESLRRAERLTRGKGK